jgi:hypothetical protein
MSETVSRDLTLHTVQFVHLVTGFDMVFESVLRKPEKQERGGSLGQTSRGGHARPWCSVGTLDPDEPERSLSLGFTLELCQYARAIARGVFRDLK